MLRGLKIVPQVAGRSPVRDFSIGCTEAFLRCGLSKDHEARIPSGKKENRCDAAGELDRLG